MLKSLGFIFFSNIEAIALYCLVMMLYRFKFREYLWEAFVVTLLINLQSYVLRNELQLGFLVPLISVCIYVLFYKFVVKIPLIWSLIGTILGFVIFSLIQTVIILVMFGSLSAARDSDLNGYLVQLVTGIVVFFLSKFLYKQGLGFKYEFDKLRFRFEDIFMVIMMFTFLITVSIIYYYSDLALNIVFFLAVILFLFYYSIRKEYGKFD